MIPLLPPPPLPHAERLVKAASRIKTPSIARQLRLRAGMPMNSTRARTALPAPPNPPRFGFASSAVVAAVVVMVTVPVAVLELEVKVTVPADPNEHEGKRVAPEGPDARTQLNATVPA